MMQVGIDPDLVKCGVAVVVDGRLTELQGLHFFDLLEFIDLHRDQAEFILEAVETDKATYQRPGTSNRQMQRISQNVGQVKGIGRLIAEYLERADANFHLVRPLSGTAKRCKTDTALFKRITGWSGSSNGDTRDAAMLALYGKRDRRLGDAGR